MLTQDLRLTGSFFSVLKNRRLLLFSFLRGDDSAASANTIHHRYVRQEVGINRHTADDQVIIYCRWRHKDRRRKQYAKFYNTVAEQAYLKSQFSQTVCVLISRFYTKTSIAL